MHRRTLLAALGAVPILWIRPAITQDRARRVGLVILGAESAPPRSLITTFRERLAQLGWTGDRNLQIDVRWAGNDPRTIAAEPVRSVPDIILAQGAEGLQPVLQETRTIPTVFVQITDPV